MPTHPPQSPEHDLLELVLLLLLHQAADHLLDGVPHLLVGSQLLHPLLPLFQALSRDDLLIQPFHLTEDDYYYDDDDYFY